MADVANSIAEKLTQRHPHVFGDLKLKGSTAVLENWAKLKAEERKKKTGKAGSVLDGVPSGAPGLQRAERLTEKASRIGFDWPDLKGVREKLDEELKELDEAIAAKDKDAIEHELGDVLFSMANLARFLNTPAEDAIRQTNKRFTARFHHMEAKLDAEGRKFDKVPLDELNALWEEAKREEIKNRSSGGLPPAPPEAKSPPSTKES
jgi:ATP diphosphatase